MKYSVSMKPMKRQVALALFVLSLGVAAFAQRGGGHAAGGGAHSFSGARSSSSSPSFSRMQPARSAYTARPNYTARPSYAGAQRYSFPASNTARRSAFYNRYGGRLRAGGYYPGYGLGYPYELGYFDAGSDGYNPNDLYDGSGQTPDENDTAQSPAASYPDSSYPDAVMPPPPQYAQAQNAPMLRHAVPPPPAAESAVTLIFKDGRPPLQIYNYALTRTMLYVTDAHHRDIPVADLDLPATQKVNGVAGVTFALPTRQ
jgi:hypothetical protein